MDNKELIERWAVDCELRGLAPLTIKIYRVAITKFFEQCQKNPAEIGIPDIKKYLLRFKETPHKINMIINGLRNFYHFLAEEGMVDKNIMSGVKGIKIRNRKLPIIFSDKEIKKIINLPQLSVKEKTILYLLSYTGMRNSEICNILMKNIDIKKRTITLEDTKNGERRYVFFRQNTKKLLKEYLPSRDISSHYLFHNHFGGRLKDWHINTLVKKAVGFAFPFDLEKRRLSHCHTFRHSFVTSWIRAGRNLFALQQIMGWKGLSGLNNVLPISKHPNTEALQREYDKVSRIEEKEKWENLKIN